MLESRTVRWILIVFLPALFSSACSGFLPAALPTPTATLGRTATSTKAWFPDTVTPTPSATRVVLPTEERRPGLMESLFIDEFNDDAPWSTRTSDYVSAVIQRGRLILTAKPEYQIISLRNEPVLTDFYAEITASLNLCKGRDTYGLLVRSNGTSDYYRLAVKCNGTTRAERVRGGEVVPLQDWLSSADVPAGSPGEVKLGVWTVGRELRFFLNDHFLFSAFDPVFPNGTIGVYIIPGEDTEMSVSFSNLSVSIVSYASPTPTSTPTETPKP